jgi:hypothetical protein
MQKVSKHSFQPSKGGDDSSPEGASQECRTATAATVIQARSSKDLQKYSDQVWKSMGTRNSNQGVEIIRIEDYDRITFHCRVESALTDHSIRRIVLTIATIPTCPSCIMLLDQQRHSDRATQVLKILLSIRTNNPTFALFDQNPFGTTKPIHWDFDS